MALTSKNLQSAVARIAAILPDLETELNDADSRLGDGDTGGMLARVIRAIDIVTLPVDAEVGQTFSAFAKATVGATGSSLGTLIATAFMTCARQTKGQGDVAWSELGTLLAQSVEAMSARGGAQLGDKTVLDALDAVAKAVDGLEDPEAIRLAAQAAAKSALNTFRPLPNKMGRARMFAEASKGLDDPGMLALVRMFDAIGS